jgi:hypothetical protein
MKVTFTQAKEIIAAHSDIIGATYLLPGGSEMIIREFRLLSHPTEKGNEITYSIIVLLQNSDYTSNVQFYVSFESVLSQLEIVVNSKK